MNFQTKLDSTHRLVINREMRKAAGIRPGQRLNVQASPGLIIVSTPHVPARLVKKGKLKVIDAPLPDISVAEAVNRARQYTR